MDTDELVCSVCRNVFEAPVVSACRHRFCSRCLDGLLESAGASSTPPCPVCRRPLRRSEVHRETDEAFLARLQALDAKCLNHDSGCTWSGARGELGNHLALCPSTPCSNKRHGCSWLGTPAQLLLHESGECTAFEESPSYAATSSSSSSSSGTKRSRYEREISSILGSKVYELEVGDRLFRATEETLRREKGSLLDEMFSGHVTLPLGSYHLGFREYRTVQLAGAASTAQYHELLNERVFIDCDPHAFELVLFWLRKYASFTIATRAIIT